MCVICKDYERCNTYCPIHKDVICSKHCNDCEYHFRPEDASNIRCRYWIGKEAPMVLDIKQLTIMVEHKRKFIERLYKQGKTRAAESVERDIQELKRKIRRLENEDGSQNGTL